MASFFHLIISTPEGVCGWWCGGYGDGLILYAILGQRLPHLNRPYLYILNGRTTGM